MWTILTVVYSSQALLDSQEMLKVFLGDRKFSNAIVPNISSIKSSLLLYVSDQMLPHINGLLSKFEIRYHWVPITDQLNISHWDIQRLIIASFCGWAYL